ncbi:hypothetical protein [Corynebacterium pacaense]|nr:hypothetical protein [Corynebacterium pacaense]
MTDTRLYELLTEIRDEVINLRATVTTQAEEISKIRTNLSEDKD